MITQQQLTDQCAPEFIKWMCEMAEGYQLFTNEDIGIDYYSHIEYEWHECTDLDTAFFPLLIHRAVEGWNKKESISFSIGTIIYPLLLERILDSEEYHIEYKFDNYQPQSLTHAECAMLDCLLEVLK